MTATEASRNFSDLLDAIERGETVTITRGNHVIAEMRPAQRRTGASLRAALEPDYVVLGGGNVKKLKELPPKCRAGDNANAFLGGFRLWEHADQPPLAATDGKQQETNLLVPKGA